MQMFNSVSQIPVITQPVQTSAGTDLGVLESRGPKFETGPNLSQG